MESHTVNQTPIGHLFIITGTTRGIGKALVASVLSHPRTAVISLSRAVPFIRNNHQNIQVDLNHTDRIGAALKRIQIEHQRTAELVHTVLINNAGVLDPIAPITDCDDNLLAGNIRVNLIAPLVLARHFYQFGKRLPGRKWVVNITSGASQAPYYGWSAYGAAKAGIDMATRAMAMEFARIDPSFGACAVAPGIVDTDMQKNIRNCSTEQFEQVGKFQKLKASGALDSPRHTASRLVRLIMEGYFENGKRYDLRTINDQVKKQW